MPMLETDDGAVSYALREPTSPWLGEAETILFHHGVGACGPCWGGWMPALLERYRLLTFDLPGHGASPVASGPLSMDRLAATVLALADAAGCERFHLVGESIGGTVALKVAVEHGPRLRSLTISNGAHLGASIENLENWRGLIDGPGGMASWSAMMMERRFHADALSAAQRDWYQRQQATADGATVLALAEALVGTDLGEAARGVDVPTLLLHPDSSPFIPVPAMADLHARLPRARLQIFAHARHGLPFSHAAACASVLRDFLDGL